MPVELDLSVICLLRNAEAALPEILTAAHALRAQISSEASFELLAFDHHSTDNSLSALKLLSRREPGLRIFAHTRVGNAIKRGARCARGKIWIFADSALPAKASAWVLRQLLDGQPGAAVDGQVLGVPRALGMQALSWHQGGLWAAQHAVHAQLAQRRLSAARHGWQSQGALGRVRLELRGRISRLHPKLRGA